MNDPFIGMIKIKDGMSDVSYEAITFSCKNVDFAQQKHKLVYNFD
jgi:hypothetical protein